jgi:hypothetical protein
MAALPECHVTVEITDETIGQSHGKKILDSPVAGSVL